MKQEDPRLMHLRFDSKLEERFAREFARAAPSWAAAQGLRSTGSQTPPPLGYHRPSPPVPRSPMTRAGTTWVAISSVALLLALDIGCDDAFEPGGGATGGSGGTTSSSSSTTSSQSLGGAGGSAGAGGVGGATAAGGHGGDGGTGGGLLLACGSEWSVPTDIVAHGAFQVFFTDSEGWTNYDVQVEGPGNPQTTGLDVVDEYPCPCTWTAIVSGHDVGVLTMTFVEGCPPGDGCNPVSSCQVLVVPATT